MKLIVISILSISFLYAERHPFVNTDIKCYAKRKQSGFFSTIYSEMILNRNGSKKKLAEFTGSYTTHSCNLAKRSSTKEKVCIAKSQSSYRSFNTSTMKEEKSYSSLASCIKDINPDYGQNVENGKMQFFSKRHLNLLRQRFPKVADKEISDAIYNPDTMFYDDTNMVFGYQDSSGSPIGMRGNRVGWDTGINADVADIKKLTELFQEEKFLFPFATAGGTDTVENKYILNFWLPPKDANGNFIPVAYYKVKSHWSWIFPVGTLVGEIIFQQAEDDGLFYPFEIRTRKRRLDGWTPDVFRPFSSAAQFAQALEERKEKLELKNVDQVISHLQNSNTLSFFEGPKNHYTKKLGEFNGYIDKMPVVNNPELVKDFLMNRPYVSVKNKAWKVSGDKTTYAPSSKGGFSIVPKDYAMGIAPVNEHSCTKCHDQTSRSVGDFIPETVAYGEMWGEDQVFTWHLFEVDNRYYFLGDDNRKVNKVMKSVNLLKSGKPSVNSLLYRELKRPYSTQYWNGYN